jgi:Flp pilus assembly pilin Flp
MITLYGQWIDDETAATSIEYAFIAALIALGIVGAVGEIAPALNSIFERVAEPM